MMMIQTDRQLAKLTGYFLCSFNELMIVFVDVLLESVRSVWLQLCNLMSQTFQVIDTSMSLSADNYTTHRLSMSSTLPCVCLLTTTQHTDFPGHQHFHESACWQLHNYTTHRLSRSSTLPWVCLLTTTQHTDFPGHRHFHVSACWQLHNTQTFQVINTSMCLPADNYTTHIRGVRSSQMWKQRKHNGWSDSDDGRLCRHRCRTTHYGQSPLCSGNIRTSVKSREISRDRS